LGYAKIKKAPNVFIGFGAFHILIRVV